MLAMSIGQGGKRILTRRISRFVRSELSTSLQHTLRHIARCFRASTIMIDWKGIGRLSFAPELGLSLVEETVRGSTTSSVGAAMPSKTDQEYSVIAETPMIADDGNVIATLKVIGTATQSLGHVERRQLEGFAAALLAQLTVCTASCSLDAATGLPGWEDLEHDVDESYRLHRDQIHSLIMLEPFEYAEWVKMSSAVGLRAVNRLLSAVARSIELAIGESALVYHMGFARFAVLFEGSAQIDEGFLRNVLDRVRQPVFVDGESYSPRPRIGVLNFSMGTDLAADVSRKAVAAVQQACRLGKTIHLYAPEDDARQKRSFQLLHDLPTGFARGEFRLVYQPKLNSRSSRCESVEALLRWEHPLLGNVPPSEFVPLVETTAMVQLVTEYVLEAALAQVAVWRRQGMDLEVAVNVAPLNLADAAFAGVVQAACDRHGVPFDRLQIECTESTALSGNTALRTLEKLQEMGINVALDDFGIGYCNLASLRNVPAQLLKIDRSLVREIDTNARALTVLKGVINMAEALGYRLLAEGVETAPVFELLVSLGCHQIQGYHFCHPLEAHEVKAFVDQWAAKKSAVGC